MRTWKNRQRPSKSSHKKTVSRKQRGGGLIETERVRAWLEANPLPKYKERYSNLVQTSLDKRIQKIVINDQDIPKVIAWEETSRKSSPYGPPPQQPDNPSNLLAQSLRRYDTYRAPGAIGSVPPAGVPTPPQQPATSSATLANALQYYRNPGVVPAQQPPGAPVEQANAAEDRLGTALASANPLARQPAGTSGLVYNLTSQGKTQTVQDCNQQLDELRKELESLRAGIVETRATLKAQEDSLSAQIAELTDKNQKLSETGEAAQEAISALTETGKTTTKQLDAAREALVGKGAEFDYISKQLQTISAELGQANTLTASQSEQISMLQGSLQESTRNSVKTKEENNTQIAELLAEHTANLDRLKLEHLAELAKLEGVLHTTREEADSVKNGTAEERKKLTQDIATLTGQIQAQKGEIGSLNSSLETVKTSLQQSKAEGERISQDAARAAGEAETAAAKASADLAQLQAANAELAQQLEAARAEAQAATQAAAESNEAKNAAEAAAAAAKTLAQTARSESDVALAEATRAAADSTKSAGEKAEAQAAAVKARAEAEQAAQAEQAAEVARNDAVARSQTAEVAKAQAEANLAQLKRSTPRITLIYGTTQDDKVGGGNGRPARMGETLNVRWQKGAQDSSAWVFVMFSGSNPAYTQLILKPGIFSFQSTVGGDINAVMFDVTVHSQQTLGF